MKKINIHANHIGLVLKNGKLDKVLTEGKYWLWLSEKAEVYDLSKKFQLQADVDVLLLNEDFREQVHVVNVLDNELVFVYENNNFKTVLSAGRHLYWKALVKYDFVKTDISKIDIEDAIDSNILDFTALAIHVRKYKIELYEKGLLYVNGVFEKIMEAGTYYWWKNATSIDVAKLDMRQMTLDMNGQEILTKDKAQLRMNFTAQYQVTDIVKALGENKEFEKQLHILLQLSLRTYVGQLSFDELMESKDKIAAFVLEDTKEAVQKLGVQLHHCGVKDIILSGELREIMNQVLIAEKKAQANVITRREETASTRSLLNTAKMMEDNQMLWKLKEMEYIEKIAEKINTISLSGGGNIVGQLKEIFAK